jgi:hypothetical protein
MKIKVSIEALGYSLGLLVGKYVDENEMPATDVILIRIRSYINNPLPIAN